ncbi:Sensor protein DivL [Pseudooceanicola marinus]|uniref:Sensor protein DivL n=1 Tax=Pseudooceanicola marinus TaxID=396013 RepID=A0A1X7A0V4_9RHOB|nr:PAS-domain containing protein [Pseudooceanicola marinus]SLN67399.1 Sensor protein DivL [Pseudooceanicola marinus]
MTPIDVSSFNSLTLFELALALPLSLALTLAALILVRSRHRDRAVRARPSQRSRPSHADFRPDRFQPGPDRFQTEPDRGAAPSGGARIPLEDRFEHLPIPSWVMTDDGLIEDGNAAYEKIAARLQTSDDILAPLRRSDERSDERPGFTYRARLPVEGRQGERWLDISARRSAGAWDCAAQDVTALVEAERAQRDFVQTLTKTFAQLSTGLAIFDHDRQLILFNPALLDLTQLSAEFLASRPALSHFFDHLRDRQIMPEPKNYATWREHLSHLVSAATDGRYQDTWSLPGGATYRVSGRPHPNGAVAFLFEDITDQIAMTRRFRQQLSLSQSVLDAFTDGIAIFDASGTLSYCNSAYRQLFGLPEATDLAGVTTDDSLRLWAGQSEDSAALEPVRRQLELYRGGDGARHEVVLKGRGPVSCTVLCLAGGARMVSFGARPGQFVPLQSPERLDSA